MAQEKAPRSLAERLQQARRRQFVGRLDERSLFRNAITAEDQPFYILHIHGPGGIGKTSLLQQFEDISREAGIAVWLIDGRTTDPSPESFLASLRQMTGLTEDDSILEGLAEKGERRVILIDNYERLRTLDRWLRQSLLPQLPDKTLVVIAGRRPPSIPWRTDPGWQPLVRTISLRNLPPDEVQNYLNVRQVSQTQYKTVLNFTHGYPLALSLMADMFAYKPGLEFQPEKEPDIIKALLDRLISNVPSPAHRTALETCALIRQTTESLLAEVIPDGDPHDLFEWLRELSIIEVGSKGLFPHDLAREALSADLRWRDQDRYRTLHKRIRNYYASRLQETEGQEQQSILIDYVFLHRDNPVVQPLITAIQAQGKSVSGFLTDIAREEDWDTLRGMVEQYEGEESAELAVFWFEQQPRNVVVFRDEENQPAGFMTFLEMEKIPAADREKDPAIKNAWKYLDSHAPLRAGEKAVYVRFWMSAETYQGLSTVQGLIAVNAVRYYLTTPGLAYSFLPCADPQFWNAIFSYADLHHTPEVDFTVGGREYGVFGHDWRAVPPASYLDLLAQREMSQSPETIERPSVIEPVMVLSKPDFSEALINALRDFTRPDMLLTNPLLRSRLVIEEMSVDSGDSERVGYLQKLIGKTASSLKESPRDIKFYRALYHTYLQPAPTQAQAAELLDLPMGTFRRHLKSGIERLTELLWQQEIGTG